MNDKLPLAGLKVLESTVAATGPAGGKYFADFGATVIKVESGTRPDVTRLAMPYKDGKPGVDRGASFLYLNTSKMSITLNFTKPRGKELYKKLVGWADVVLQNRRPGAMQKLGLGYDELRKVKEDIIMIDVSISGQEGPYADAGGWGQLTMAMCGQFNLMRWPGQDPLAPGFTAPPDAVAPRFMVIATLAALDYKRRTGKGQYIDLSQIEPMCHFLAPGILDYVTNKRIQAPVGNRSERAAPHGAFPCKGDDKWCAISVSSDEEWVSLCKVIGNPEWTKRPIFANFESRKKYEDELEQLVGNWTKNYSPWEVMAVMQEAGVPAGVLENVDDLIERDPQMKERGLFFQLEHPVLGKCYHPREPFILSKTPAKVGTSPLQGQHNKYVFTEILGLTDEEFTKLLEEKIID
jgi:benzylsuccinate CoA-transferase BbsF subunit